MKIDVEELSKINLEEGDVLVVKLKQRTGPKKQAEYPKELSIGKVFEELFPNNRVIFARHDDKFEVIKQKALIK